MKYVLITLLATATLSFKIAYGQHISKSPNPYIGFRLSAGGGFESFNTGLITNDNKEIRCSTGGGTSVGISGAAPVSGPWMVGGEVNYQFTSIDPPVNNASGGFTHTNIILTGKYFFPLGVRHNGIIVSAGPVFSRSNEYELDAEKVPDGQNLAAVYKNGTGMTISSDFLLSRGKGRVGFLMGLRYTAISYSMERFSFGNMTIESNNSLMNNLESRFRKPDGSGLDLTLALVYSL